MWLGTRLDGIVAANAKLEKLADGYAWLEGPVWLRREGALLFSDVSNNVIHRYDAESGVSVFLQPSGYKGTAHGKRRGRADREVPGAQPRPAQLAMLLSARKEPGKYTEGAVLSASSPRRSPLALAMTEPEEKAERLRIMRHRHCTELGAAYAIAQRLAEGGHGALSGTCRGASLAAKASGGGRATSEPRVSGCRDGSLCARGGVSACPIATPPGGREAASSTTRLDTMGLSTGSLLRQRPLPEAATACYRYYQQPSKKSNPLRDNGRSGAACAGETTVALRT